MSEGFTRRLRAVSGAVGAIGMALFGALFIASYVDPVFVENLAKDVIRIEVESRVHQRIDALDASFLVDRARQLVQVENEKIASIRLQMKQGVPRRLTAVLDRMREKNCECRNLADTIEKGFHPLLEGQVATAQRTIAFLDGMIRAKYMETAGQVTREFRIFTGTNAVVFALLALAVVARRKAGAHLVPATLILVGSAAITAGCYLFNQDWLHTLLFAEYVGLAYTGYLGVAMAMVADVIFNRARVTIEVLNALGHIISAPFALLPC